MGVGPPPPRQVVEMDECLSSGAELKSGAIWENCGRDERPLHHGRANECRAKERCKFSSRCVPQPVRCLDFVFHESLCLRGRALPACRNGPGCSDAVNQSIALGTRLHTQTRPTDHAAKAKRLGLTKSDRWAAARSTELCQIRGLIR